LEEGIGLAQAFGAGSVLLGNLVRMGGDVRVDAQLVRSEDHATVARVAASAPGEDVGTLADSTTWALLAEVWRPGAEVPTPHMTRGMTSSFEALRAFLEGEEAHRAGRYQRAWEAYERAFTADSTFWLAYWRYTAARNWMMLGVDSAIVTAYQDHIDEFPKLDRELLEERFMELRSASAEARRRLTERRPDYYPGWWRYGDAILHSGIIRRGEPLSEVIRAFERVIELNPRMISAWEHLLYCYAMERDSEGMENALGMLDELGGREAILEGYGFDVVTMNRYFLRYRLGESSLSEVADTLAGLVREARLVQSLMYPAIARISAIVGEPALQIESNLRYAQDPGSYDPTDLLLANALTWASRGAWDSMLVNLDRYHTVSGEPIAARRRFYFSALGVFYGALPAEEALRRRPTPEADVDGWTRAQHAQMAWHDGFLGFVTEDREAIADARARLAAMDTSATTLLDRSLEVFGLELQGDREGALGRLAELDHEIAEDAPGISIVTMNAVHRSLLAEWLTETGDFQRALDGLRWHRAMHTVIATLDVAVLVSSVTYLEMGRVAEAMGRAEDALKYYREFLYRYDMPPEVHLPLIEEAEAALERLGGDPG
jgi:tetratricopeptide (TPR) repeat protein